MKDSGSIQNLNRENRRCEKLHTVGVNASGLIQSFNRGNHSSGKVHTRGVKTLCTFRNFNRRNQCHGKFHTQVVKMLSLIRRLNKEKPSTLTQKRGRRRLNRENRSFENIRFNSNLTKLNRCLAILSRGKPIFEKK